MPPGDTDRTDGEPESKSESEAASESSPTATPSTPTTTADRGEGTSTGDDEGGLASAEADGSWTDGGAVHTALTGESARPETQFDADTDADTHDSESDGRGGFTAGELPYIFARRTVKADREALPVYVRDETATGVESLERHLDERFERDDLMALDVREALVAVGLQNAEDVVATLEAWGYGRR